MGRMTQAIGRSPARRLSKTEVANKAIPHAPIKAFKGLRVPSVPVSPIMSDMTVHAAPITSVVVTDSASWITRIGRALMVSANCVFDDIA